MRLHAVSHDASMPTTSSAWRIKVTAPYMHGFYVGFPRNINQVYRSERWMH